MSVSAPTRHIFDSRGTSPELLLFWSFHTLSFPNFSGDNGLLWRSNRSLRHIVQHGFNPISHGYKYAVHKPRVTSLLQTCYKLVAIGSGHVKSQNQPLSLSLPPHIRGFNRCLHSYTIWPHRSDYWRRVLSVEAETTTSSCYFYGPDKTTCSWIFSRPIQRHTICLQKPIMFTTMTTTAIGDEHEKDWMVTNVTMVMRYVMTLPREHIPTVQGFGYYFPRNPVVSSPQKHDLIEIWISSNVHAFPMIVEWLCSVCLCLM